MIKYSVFVLCLAGFLRINGQDNFKALKVGEKVQDYLFHNLVNYPSDTVYLSAFKNKLLILDFWHTNCAECVESWPKLETLQKQFEGKIQILLINTSQDKATVRKIIEKRRNAGVVNLTLPSVCGDTVIAKLFPYNSIPHIIWIDGSGYLKSVTYGWALNAKNIKAILDGEPVNMLQKELDRAFIKDYSIPLLLQDDQSYIIQSVFKKYAGQLLMTHGMGPGNYICAFNRSAKEMYRFAYSDLRILKDDQYSVYWLPNNRVQVLAKDPTLYESVVNGELRVDNLYVYQLTAAEKMSADSLQRYMQMDLLKYFGLKVNWEKQMRKCLVLSMPDSLKVKYTAGKYNLNITDESVAINNVTIEQIVYELENGTKYYYSPYPVIDETGFKGKVGDINFSTNVYDHNALNKALHKYGMSLTLQDREVDILVLKELS